MTKIMTNNNRVNYDRYDARLVTNTNFTIKKMTLEEYKAQQVARKVATTKKTKG